MAFSLHMKQSNKNWQETKFAIQTSLVLKSEQKERANCCNDEEF